MPTPEYALPTILNMYGQPTEVWLRTGSAPLEDYLPFTLKLFYEQHGFMMSYASQGVIEEGKVKSCFPTTTFVVIASWSPLEDITYEEAHSPTSMFKTTEYEHSLEEATGMTIDTFYETFNNPAEPVCLETPTELWPGP